MRACNCARASPFQSTHPRGVRHDDLPVLPPLRPRFNPRTRVGCDLTSITCGCLRDGGFNPRTRVGCDTIVQAQPGWDTVFQSTHPRGVRRSSPPGAVWSTSEFQSTHPRGVRPVSAHGPCFRVACFNPRTRVGCDNIPISSLGLRRLFQSTHPRGVRRTSSSPCCRTSWFQSTHPRGVRLDADGPHHHDSKFQSTHPRGVRLFTFLPTSSLLSVSIHAPAWGATTAFEMIYVSPNWFQSTHPRGVRHTNICSSPRNSKRFNPRTRVGCDRGFETCTCPNTVSIHAPAWGATGNQQV